RPILQYSITPVSTESLLLRQLCCRGHGHSALLIGCPELGLATIRGRGSIYCELSGVVNLARALEIKGLQLPRRQFFATHFYQKLRDQGALHHQTGELFDFSDIVPIIVDAVGVVPNRGKTEQQRRIGFNHLAPGRLSRNRGWCRGRRLGSLLAEHNHIAFFDDGEPAAVRDTVALDHGHHAATWPVVDLDIGDLSDPRDLVADSQRLLKRHTGTADAATR